MTVQATPTDSTDESRTHWHFTPRIQSLGFFVYSGKIGCENPTFDFNVNLEKNNWGYFFFKSIDMENIHSQNNFALTMVYRKLTIGQRLTVTPYLGFLIDQTHNIVGANSDVSLVLTTSYKLNEHWRLDNSAIFPPLMIEPSSKDWTNRFRIIYRHEHVELTILSWHNNKIFDGTTYISEGFSAYYNKIKISEHAYLNTGITGLWMLDTSDEESNPKRNGVLLTLSVEFN
jgi:hypothetical protein